MRITTGVSPRVSSPRTIPVKITQKPAVANTKWTFSAIHSTTFATQTRSRLWRKDSRLASANWFRCRSLPPRLCTAATFLNPSSNSSVVALPEARLAWLTRRAQRASGDVATRVRPTADSPIQTNSGATPP